LFYRNSEYFQAVRQSALSRERRVQGPESAITQGKWTLRLFQAIMIFLISFILINLDISDIFYINKAMRSRAVGNSQDGSQDEGSRTSARDKRHRRVKHKGR
jgi:hypothetical protein